MIVVPLRITIFVKIPKFECWHLPIFGVYHPQKPGQIRVVFDSSVQHQGISLRPLVPVSSDPYSPCVLTPAVLLTQKPVVPVPVENYTEKDLLR